MGTHDGRLRGFAEGAREFDDSDAVVRGRLPDWLRGNLLLNGPARWELPGGRWQHWFDGLAMLHRVRIGEGRASYRSRWLHSHAAATSLAAGRPMTGEFGSPNPKPWWQRLFNNDATDNTAVVMSRVGAEWLAASETPFFWRFDPQTLATGAQLSLKPSGQQAGSTHGITLVDGSYLNVGTAFGARNEQRLYRLRPGGSEPEVLARLPMKKVGYTHAFALAAGHALLWECAWRARPLALRFGGKSYAKCHEWLPGEGSRLHAVALADGRVRSWDIPPMMAFHALQAWRDGTGADDPLVLDLATFDDTTIVDELMLDPLRAGAAIRSRPRVLRYRLVTGQAEAVPEDTGWAVDLPQVHPACIGARRAAVCWGAAFGDDGAFFDRTQRIDVDSGAVTSWQRGDAVQLEPHFVPRPGGTADDDGVLLVHTLADGDAGSVIAVLDAHALSPLAEIALPQVVPFGFHNAFAAA